MADYLVKITTTPAAADAKPVTTERLVRATNKAGAINHVVSDSVVATLATTEDIIKLAQAGVKLETAE